MRRAMVVACALLLSGSAACKRKHVAVDSVPELGYPTCDGDAASSEARVIARGKLRSGPMMREQNVVETFEIAQRGCQVVYEGRQEWPLEAADVEVIYDESLRPIRAWKRMAIPGATKADANADIRRYELRTPDVTIKRHDRGGEVLYELLKPGGKIPVAPGAKVEAVVGPGRGLLTMWIQREKLSVGQKSHALVLDFRDMVETVEEQSLQRDDDRFEPSLGKTVRVYTIYGHDTVFADDHDVVIGDLAGLRPSESLTTPEPPPIPAYAPPDPVHTP